MKKSVCDYRLIRKRAIYELQPRHSYDFSLLAIEWIIFFLNAKLVTTTSLFRCDQKSKRYEFIIHYQTPLNSAVAQRNASSLRNGPAKGHADFTLRKEKSHVAANARRIRDDECEYSHGRARNKAVGENVGELFVRRALAQKSMTKSERFMGEGDAMRQKLRTRRNDRPRQQQRR